MEWIDGEKLMDGGGGLEEDFALVKEGIQCTLSQLLETGIMHADPHGGNLLKVERRPAEETHPPHRRVRDRVRRRFVDPYPGRYPDSSSSAQRVGTSYQLAYLDFGLVSRVPVSVRDGIVAAVVLLVDRRYQLWRTLRRSAPAAPRVMEDKEERILCVLKPPLRVSYPSKRARMMSLLLQKEVKGRLHDFLCCI